MARVFAVMARANWVIRVSRYKFERRHKSVSVTNLESGHWRSVAKFNRSQKLIMVQDFDYVQMRVSGFNSDNEFVLHAGAKAKSVTNNLPLLSVLGLVF
jgi:hypothetical protein